MKIPGVMPAAMVMATVVTLLGSCSSAEEAARKADCERIKDALAQQQLQPTAPASPEAGSPQSRKTIAAFAQVQPHLKDPELAKAIATVVESDRRAQTLPKSGGADAQVEVTNQTVEAMQVFLRVCAHK